MSAWELPQSLTVGNKDWTIRSDFRVALDILKYFDDPNYEEDEQWMICLDILFEDFASMSPKLYYLHSILVKKRQRRHNLLHS